MVYISIDFFLVDLYFTYNVFLFFCVILNLLHVSWLYPFTCIVFLGVILTGLWPWVDTLSDISPTVIYFILLYRIKNVYAFLPIIYHFNFDQRKNFTALHAFLSSRDGRFSSCLCFSWVFQHNAQNYFYLFWS